MSGPRLRRGERLRPRFVLAQRSPNQSARQAGVPLNLIVLHSTESHNRPGTSDVAAILSFFANPSSQVSSHVTVDAEGNSGRSVGDDRKAWTQGAFNSAALSIEMIAYASQGLLTYRKRWRQLREVARHLARWSLRHGIPLRRGAVSGYAVTRSGIVTHQELGSIGGGHTDPGPFPMRRLLLLARLYRAARLARQ